VLKIDEENLLMNICPSCEKRNICYYCVSCEVQFPEPDCIWHTCLHVQRVVEYIFAENMLSVDPIKIKKKEKISVRVVVT